MATFHLLNFGCRASQADGAAVKRQLLDAGLEEAPSAEQSQVAVLNTCTVTATADAEVRQIVRRIHRANPYCRILVTGCYAQRAPEEVAQLPGVAWVVGNSHKHLIADVLGKQPGSEVRSQKTEGSGQAALVQIERRRPIETAPAPAAELSIDSGVSAVGLPQMLVGEIGEQFHFAPAFADDHTRPTFKVQDGCNARCSFCVIPKVRGRSRSLAPEEVIAQVRELEQAGYKEVVLSGINLGSYGKDLGRRITFLGLVERILTDTSLARLRVSSIEVMDVSPALIDLVAREPRMAQHFHVPLQSGCDRILRLMNRRYWAAQYAERLRAIHEQIPYCAIGADVMVGFPGETDLDHQTSLRFIESLPFTYLHVFPYSARPGTPAAARPGQLNGRVIRERGQEMRNLIAQKRRAFLAAQIGRTLSVLTLDEARENTRVALSTNYLKVALPFSDRAPNTLLDVRVGRVDEGLLYGYRES
ncbi:MAG: tRNA (N(6)-L-threonylcarbamoyladenosine(37)-C(2))-methylthiotransferase MtaB [Terriglobia bacterium]